MSSYQLDVSDALIVNLPTTNTLIDGQIVATYNGQDLYMSSYHPTTAQEGFVSSTVGLLCYTKREPG
jgi:hypothetical protein